MVAACICTADSVRAQSTTRSLGGGAVTAQVATGLLGSAVGFVGGGLTTRWAATRLGATEEQAGRAGLAGAYASTILVTAVGPSLIGSRNTSKGSYVAAVGGAAGGLAAAALLRKAGRKGIFGRSGPVAFLAGLTIVALPSIGATLAFNATR
jgi:hypothetical protein